MTDTHAIGRHDLEAKIVKRCWEDEAFRKEFASDPAGAFTKYLGIQREQLPKILVHEEPSGSWHIVLPAKPSNVAELSDEELEQVAGGVTISLVTLILTAVATLAGGGGISASAAISLKKGW